MGSSGQGHSQFRARHPAARGTQDLAPLHRGRHAGGGGDSGQGPERSGCVATIDVLGESTESKADAARTLRDYKKVIDALDEHNLESSGISVKLTGLGLTIERGAVPGEPGGDRRLRRRAGRFVRVDMEDSPYTGVTLEMVTDLHERHENVGRRDPGLHAAQPRRRGAPHARPASL